MSIENLPENAIPLGPRNWYTKGVDKDEKWCAIIEYHLKPGTDNQLCSGWVPFDVQSAYLTPHGDKWTVNSYDPLDLSPSLLCTICGSHGFIREGKWVDA